MTDADLERGGVDHEQSLDDLAEVPQVERVVALRWSGQQLGCNGVVDVDTRLNDLVAPRRQLVAVICSTMSSVTAASTLSL